MLQGFSKEHYAPLYKALPDLDKCALQVHEVFRHLGTMGVSSGSRWLKKELTTTEIEALTRTIVYQRDLEVAKLFPTVYWAALAEYGKSALLSKTPAELRAIEQDLTMLNGLEPSTEINLAGSLFLQRLHQDSKVSVQKSELEIWRIGEVDPKTHAAQALQANQNNLQPPPIDLSEFFAKP